MAAATTGGPATKSWALPRTMTLKWLRTTAPADDRVGRQEARQLAPVVVLALARQGPGLVEAAGVQQALHALAHRELAGGVLARDALGPAHLACELLAAAQLVELGLPGHPD